MRWKGREQSGNVEDRRGTNGRKLVAGGSIGALAIVIIVWLLGGNPSELLNNIQAPANESGSVADSSVIIAETELADFASVVLKETEDVWHDIFNKSGDTYKEPVLVLFSGSVESACGYSSAATGPFYCPGDEKVYIDLSFLEDLQKKLSAEGDFAMAYIIAHEVGHHVQKLTGTTAKLDRLRNNVSETDYNRNLVKLELQADFYAGIWAHYLEKDILEEGDIEEAFNAAEAVGDDRIQMQSQGYVVPDAFTHGTSEQRKSSFLKGYDTGDITKGAIDFD